MKSAVKLALMLLLLTPIKAQAKWNEQSLQRLSQDQNTSAYSFIVTGDNRDGNSIFSSLMRRAADFQPRFMLHTGDFVKAGGQQEYLNFLSLIRQARYPILPALGNHDIVAKGREWYQHYFGESRLAFSYGKDRFVMLDNANGSLEAEQLQWLESELKKPARYRFVFMHMPPRNMIWFHAFTKGSREMMRLVELYKANYVFMGHVHIYDKMINRGVNYLISGGAGAPLFRMPLYFHEEGGAFNHFVLIQVSNQGIKEQIVPLTP